MNVDVINKFMLSLFFIYLLLVSSNLNQLLGCATQKVFKRKFIYKTYIVICINLYINIYFKLVYS